MNESPHAVEAASVPQSQVDAAAAYETLFVPALFGQWAPMVVDTVELKSGEHILDVACGIGVLAREAAKRVGQAGLVTGLDPHAGMLTVARRLAPAIDWREGMAESLPFPDQVFDVAVSQFGLMFFRDRHKAITEMLRVTKKGGRCAAAVWDDLTNVPLFADLVALLDRSTGKEAGDALRAPFALGNKRALAALFRAAGAESVEVETHRGVGRFPSLRDLVEAELRGWLPVMGVNLSEREIERLLGEAEGVLAPYVSRNGALIFDMPAHIVSASRV